MKGIHKREKNSNLVVGALCKSKMDHKPFESRAINQGIISLASVARIN